MTSVSLGPWPEWEWGLVGGKCNGGQSLVVRLVNLPPKVLYTVKKTKKVGFNSNSQGNLLHRVFKLRFNLKVTLEFWVEANFSFYSRLLDFIISRNLQRFINSTFQLGSAKTYKSELKYINLRKWKLVLAVLWLVGSTIPANWTMSMSPDMS